MSLSNHPIRRVLVSVYDKAGLDVLAPALAQAGCAVVSTGSTARQLSRLGLSVQEVSDLTGFPESFDGKVKTLDPHIHAGILADRSKADHVRQLRDLNIEPFDLVVVNLYPFADTVRQDPDDQAAIIEKIDIGGPSMVRAAAKNSGTVLVVTDPADYPLLANRISSGQGFSLAERHWFASKAFSYTAAYEASISQWAGNHWPRPESLDVTGLGSPESDDDAQGQELEDTGLATTLTRSWNMLHALRYGENPQQSAVIYTDPLSQDSFAQAEQLGGKAMSYNNYVDADAAWRSVWDFAPHIAVAVVKHNNPCGLALGETVAQAHLKAHACDPMSAYGGVIASNSPVSLEMAQNIRPIFTEVIVAPDYDPEALSLLQSTKTNLRILKVRRPPQGTVQIHTIDGGLLAQSMDRIDAAGDDPRNWTLAAGQQVDEATLMDLHFAWRAIRSVKSNAILLAKDHAAVGIGMGQVNRVDSCRLAVDRANSLADGERRAIDSVAASDAFFPFADGAQVLIDAGIKAIVQPGGSIRDQEVIEAVEQAGISMYLTGTRHFFH
ncbi:bifunctional phosphoribosylaminoimidazolecarboxamide formyltransferase/IMP cyclohydrolase PurH [Bifidobacterium aemilianum]|uniref:Bifunctional purine biosynthesis protein PurH n=1 Tax=Bifidobacterium aemilianum TaxID=2493120 RepID=A0A366KBN1_9BIFI|nr:bifunctional phosphoribosylaminoimidazolecarboxamide formyltransferase/IMP cyclohydrolase [Bifidobacterium aemilianum]RBP98061.1 bifunctional phosphoribosylaminoimidazolecarboxamide formyltransferase/IMP cyclohydrolase PurH [Bifidobacterium aemilianum]